MLQRFFSTLAATLQRRLPGTTVQDKVLPTDCGLRFDGPSPCWSRAGCTA